MVRSKKNNQRKYRGKQSKREKGLVRRSRKTRISRKSMKPRKTRISRKSMKPRKRRISRKSRKTRSKAKKGGTSCPFVGKPWNATNDSRNFFRLSDTGVSPGGVPVFPRGSSRQNGGNMLTRLTPQFLLDSGRLVTTSGANLVNNFKGLRRHPSPLPMYDQLSPKDLRKRF